MFFKSIISLQNFSRAFCFNSFLVILGQATTIYNDLHEYTNAIKNEIPSDVPISVTPFAAKILGFSELTLAINVTFLYLLLFKRRDLYKYLFNQLLLYNGYLKDLYKSNQLMYTDSQRKSVSFGKISIKLSSVISLVMPTFLTLALTHKLELAHRVIQSLTEVNLTPSPRYVPFLIFVNVCLYYMGNAVTLLMLIIPMYYVLTTACFEGFTPTRLVSNLNKRCRVSTMSFGEVLDEDIVRLFRTQQCLENLINEFFQSLLVSFLLSRCNW